MHHFKKNYTKLPNIIRMIERLLLQNLRGEVVRSTESSMSSRHHALKLLGAAEVSKFHNSFLRQKDIIRFQVPVDNVGIMQILNSLNQLHKNLHSFSLLKVLPL